MALHGSAALAALALSGCGGGGGGGPRPTPAPTPLPPVVTVPAPTPAPPPPAPTPAPAPAPAPAPVPPPPPTGTDFNTDEFRRSNAVTSSGAITAWQAGATGAGVKIAVVDSGLNLALNEFAGRIDPASTDTAGTRGVSDEDGHGSAVTAVAAAGRNDSGTVGVAFNATVISYRTDQPGTCATTAEDEGCSHNDTDIAEAIDLARVAGARVINMSLGGSNPAPGLVQAINRATAAGVIIVVSAGNDGEDPAKAANPDPFGLGLALNDPSGLVILAGSVGADIDGSSDTRNDVDLTRISVFSNRAGSGLRFYLGALGFRVVAPNTADENRLYLFSGTSFSAPVISGAVALLAQAFPNLTGRQIVDLLFRTANDLGQAGDDEVFGQGSLNIARAFQPQGQTLLAGSNRPVSLVSNGALPAASGDAKIGSAGAVILDDYARAFHVELGGTVRGARAQRPLGRALGGDLRTAGAQAGAVAVSVTTATTRNRAVGVGLAQLGMSYQDGRNARVIAGMALAQLSSRTSVAFGLSEGAKALKKRLAGVEDAPFMIARDPHGTSGLDSRRGDAAAVRQQVGRFGLSVSGERGRVDDPLRPGGAGLRVTTGMVTADAGAGPVHLTVSASRMREDETVLGGRFDAALGGTGATSWFADGAARFELGRNWWGTMRYRRGWTGFGADGGGRLSTDAFSFDLGRASLLRSGDRLGLRIAQPLRVRSGGLDVMLPVSYDYRTLTPGFALATFDLAPEGREIDLEAAYSLPVAGGWLGANAFARRQPGHVAAATTDLGAAVQFTLGF